MNDQQVEQAQQARRSAIVTSASGESDHNDDEDDSSSADNDALFPPVAESEQDADDELYDPHGDEENEAFVYKHMRCGLPETVQVRNAEKSGSNRNTEETKRLQALKPRHSDAVLSCPCCFEIVCMDCQQHDRHANQFRAMFVMNVAVHWDHVLTYDTSVQGLVRVTDPAGAGLGGAGTSGVDSHTTTTNQIPPESGSSDSHSNSNSGKVEIPKDAGSEYYYQTVCANCQTQVAALDMTDEVYHFYGCLASF
jgi:hypothetical protein